MRNRAWFIISLIATAVLAQQQKVDTRRFDENSGLSHTHATQILQDNKGMIWISTWNGLCRYDGYEFERMATRPGDGCSMPSDRIRDIWLNDDGKGIFCLVEDSLFLFDLNTCQFRDIASRQEMTRAKELRNSKKNRGVFNGKYIEFTDRQGQEWQVHKYEVICNRTLQEPCTPQPQPQPAEIRCMAKDRKNRCWITTKEDAVVRLYDDKMQLTGYLLPNGSIAQHPGAWQYPIYCICQTHDGTLWMGSKPGGLIRLKETSGGFVVEKIEGLPVPNVYDIKEDSKGRLWIATLGGGIACMLNPQAQTPTIITHFDKYPASLAQKVRYIHLAGDNTLIATTTEGLIVGEMAEDISRTRFRLHRKEAGRTTSLSCNATMDVIEDDRHRLFVSTESGGINEIISKDLTTDTLSFRRCQIKGGWPTDVVLSMVYHKGHILAVSNNQLIDYDPQREEGAVFDMSFFGRPYRFSEARPVMTPQGQWLIGTSEEALLLDTAKMRRQSYVPALVLTGIAIQNGQNNLAADNLDTLRLSPTERSLTIHFAALDYTNPQRIRYAYKLGKDEEAWNTIGNGHSLTLLDLKPDTYILSIRSTNGDGTWVDNTRRLVIIAEPTFWETPWAMLLITAIILLIAAIVIYTLLYIRRVNRRQRETLEAYLALLDKETRRQGDKETGRQEDRETRSQELALKPEDDAFIKRVVHFVEEHLGDSDISIGDMADAAAVSRSGLQRKLKQLMGVTPIDFLREARIKKACQLLRETDLTIVEIAYKCGFSDAKYFSKSFKASVGKSPTDYKNAL